MSHRFALPVAAILLAGHVAPAKALVMRVPSTAEKVVASDTVVVGKVVAFEDKEIEAAQFPGAPMKVKFKVASIKVDDVLSGAKGITHLRVGFIPMADENAAPPGRFRRPIWPGMQPNLAVGQQGVFFLAKHPEADFAVIPPFATPLEKKDENYAKQVAFIKKSVELLKEPVKSLRAGGAEDRLLTASLLLQKYASPRQQGNGQPKREPVPAEESRLILQAMLDAEWTDAVRDDSPSPLMLFQRLGLTPQDGFQYPRAKPGQDFNKLMADAAKSWLKENVDKYRVQKWAE